MDDFERVMLQDLYVAQVLCLAKQLKAKKTTTSDCIDEAVREIQANRSRVLEARSHA